MITSWNDAEEEALDYLRWDDQVVYLRGLRRYMDYRTGIVGVKRHINRKGMQELLEVHSKAGSHHDTPEITVSYLRGIFKRLIDVGLIKRVPEYAQTLVFELPLADTDKSARQSNARGAHEERTTRSAPDEASNGGGSRAGNARGAHEERTTRSAPHPESGIRYKNSVAAEGGTTPHGRVDQGAYKNLLLQLFPGHEKQIAGEKVAAMVEVWVRQEVALSVVEGAHQAVINRGYPTKFGPVYLQQVVTESQGQGAVGQGRGLPRHDDQLVSWASKQGYPPPPAGYSFTQYRAYLERRIQERNRDMH